MNALEIIQQLRALDADVVLEGKGLIIRGNGAPLPEELHAALREHRAEVMVALGAPAQMSVEAVLDEIRPYLPPALKDVSNENLIVLINWCVIHAWNRAVKEVTR
jgi:hypothetical protein